MAENWTNLAEKLKKIEFCRTCRTRFFQRWRNNDRSSFCPEASPEELNDPFELLVVKIKVSKKEIRIISGYGPQDSWAPAQREPFFQALEEEIVKAELAGKSVFIEANINSKLGKDFIQKDPHQQDKNGKLLAGILKRQNLTVANGLMVCNGTITRKCVTTTRTE